MDTGQDTLCDTAAGAGFGWAQRMLRRQLDTLSRLASVALRLAGTATRQASGGSGGIVALERALRVHERVAWALRLIGVLRAKLTGDLQSLERGEAPHLITEGEPLDDGAAESARESELPESLNAERAERAESLREAPERDDFDRLLRRTGDGEFTDILKRPTDEIIALICRELGLPPDWLDLAEDDEDDAPADRRARNLRPGPRPPERFAPRPAGRPPPRRSSYRLRHPE